MKLSDYSIVFVGCGRMGAALARGCVASGAVSGAALHFVDVDAQRAEALADELGGGAGRASEGPRMFVIATKPDAVRTALGTLDAQDQDIVVSVAAGVGLAQLRTWCPRGTIVRAMPNTPALVGAGVTGFIAPPQAREVTEEFFGAVGVTVELSEEKHFDALTAVSGSGPAYMFTAIEALADGGVLMGLDRATAVKLAVHTVRGAGELAAQSGVHTAELRDRVASPGGTTIAGLQALEQRGFRAALIEAVRAAAQRSRELGEKLS